MYLFKKNISFLLLLFFSYLSSSYHIPSEERHFTLILDAGHGGTDTGCKGITDSEKNVALDITLEVGAMVKKMHPDVRVLYTRSNDEFIELRNRSKFANQNKANLFISIHCNADRLKRGVGTESYVYSKNKDSKNLAIATRENSVIYKEKNGKENYQKFFNQNAEMIKITQQQRINKDLSKLFAQNVENHFKNSTHRKSRGVKEAGFIVLYQNIMPSILVETGFLTTPKEESYMTSKKGKLLISSAIYKAFRDFKARYKN